MRSPNEATAGGVSEFSSISSLYLIELYSSRSFSRETCLINPQVLGSLYYRECLLTRDILLIAFQRWSLPPINITCLLTLTSGDGDLVICHLCFLPKVPQVKKMNPHQANHHMYLLHQNYTFVSNTKISRTIWVTLWDTKKTSSSSLSLVPPRDDRAWSLSGYIPCHGPHSASSFLPHHLASAYLWFCHSDNTPCLLAFTLVFLWYEHLQPVFLASGIPVSPSWFTTGIHCSRRSPTWPKYEKWWPFPCPLHPMPLFIYTFTTLY